MNASYKISLVLAVGLFLFVIVYYAAQDGESGGRVDSAPAAEAEEQASPEPAEADDESPDAEADTASADEDAPALTELGGDPAGDEITAGTSDQADEAPLATEDAGDADRFGGMGSPPDEAEPSGMAGNTDADDAAPDEPTDGPALAFEDQEGVNDGVTGPNGADPGSHASSNTPQADGPAASSPAPDDQMASGGKEASGSTAQAPAGRDQNQPDSLATNAPFSAGANTGGDTEEEPGGTTVADANDSAEIDSSDGPATSGGKGPGSGSAGGEVSGGESDSGTGDEPERDVPATHAVRKGEQMWDIAEKFYGHGRHWRAIAQANPMTDPQTLRPGDELSLPSLEEVTGGGRDSDAEIEGDYTLQAGDTLSDVARRFYDDPTKWRRIYEANRDRIGDNPNRLKAGMPLIVPPEGASKN